ncbi:MAG: hypothetical protein ABWX60_04440 [Aeromicrobium sp.]
MAERSETEEQRRARIERAARLLGDLMPSTTRDESPEGWGDEAKDTSRDDEFRRDVPPHHGKD